MRWGVTYSALLFNMVFTMETFLLSKNLLTLLLCVPIHGVCMLSLRAGPPVFRPRSACVPEPACRRSSPTAVCGSASSYSPLFIDLTDRARPTVPGIASTFMFRCADEWIVHAYGKPPDRCGRDRSAAERIPYSAHVAPRVVRTEFGDYLQTFRLAGASFESGDDAELNNWHERLNVLWRNIASPMRLLVDARGRRRASILDYRAPDAAKVPRAAIRGTLHGAIGAGIWSKPSWSTSCISAVLYRPVPGKRDRTGFARGGPYSARGKLAELGRCDRCVREACADPQACRSHDTSPSILGCYRHGKFWCSSLLEYLGSVWSMARAAASRCRAGLQSGALASVRLYFGTEAIEYRSPTDTRVGAMLGIKEYPTPTTVGMYDGCFRRLLSFVLTQSFTFLTKATGQALLQRQFNRMANAGDFAVSQARNSRMRSTP